MPSITTNAPFPPTTTQIFVGSGIFTAAYVARAGLGYSDYEFTIYDSAGNGDTTTPILTMRSQIPQFANDVSDGAHGVSIAFTKGLMIVQKTSSSVTVAWQ